MKNVSFELKCLVFVCAVTPARSMPTVQEPGDVRLQNAPVHLEARSQWDFGAELLLLSRRADAKHVIVQFDSPLTSEQRASVADAGLNLLQYLDRGAFYASLSSGNLNVVRILEVQSLRRVGPIEPLYRLRSDLVAGNVPPWIVRPPLPTEAYQAGPVDGATNPIVAVAVVFHGDVSLTDEARTVCVRHSAEIRGDADSINLLEIEIPFANLAGLAQEDSVEWIEPSPPPPIFFNDSLRCRLLGTSPGCTTGLPPDASDPPYGLNGTGIDVLLEDAGPVSRSHEDLDEMDGSIQRIRIPLDTYPTDCLHSTFVAGSLAGSGERRPSDGRYRGVARKARILSYSILIHNHAGCSGSSDPPQWPLEPPASCQPVDACPSSGGALYCDVQKDYKQAIQTYGAKIATNSWGLACLPVCTCAPQGNMGAYDDISALLDGIARGSLDLSKASLRLVIAVGNFRQYDCNPPLSGYQTLANTAAAKNPIGVGAIYSGNSAAMTMKLSSWGPTKDGRLKPDLCAPGSSSFDFDSNKNVGITSCCPLTTPNDDCCQTGNGYFQESGTSISAPAVAGCAAILLQDLRSFSPAQPDFYNSTLKAILIHTAVDLLGNECGSGYPCWSCSGSGSCSPLYVGPDYASGYGSVNLTDAVNYQRTKNAFEWIIGQDGVFTIPVTYTSSSSAKITLAWDDPPAAASTAGPKLINNLDLIVTNAAGTRFFPWTLGGTYPPSAPARRDQPNNLDNVEQVLIPTPDPSTSYTVKVQGTNVPQGPQTFSLCIGNAAGTGLADPLCSQKGAITFKQVSYACPTATAYIEVVDRGPNANPTVPEVVTVNVGSSLAPTGVSVTLTETGTNTGRFIGSLVLGGGGLAVCDGDPIIATYVDANDGSGGLLVPVTASTSVSGTTCVICP